jgi:hypothetical protein
MVGRPRGFAQRGITNGEHADERGIAAPGETNRIDDLRTE